MVNLFHRISSMHAVTEHCKEVHCHFHERDEPGSGWQICGECGHLFQTADDLVREFRKMIWAGIKFDGIRWRSDGFSVSTWSQLKTMWKVKASSITFCPFCAHDW